MSVPIVEREQRFLPRLADHGYSVEPTDGDVQAIFAGALRLLRGERIESVDPEMRKVVVEMMSDDYPGWTEVSVGSEQVQFTNAYDALVYAYGRISSFNHSWQDFEAAAAEEGNES